MREQAPMPLTLDEALKEIERLRNALIAANERWAAAKLKAEKDRRAARGENAELRRQVEYLKKGIGC